MKHRVAVVGIGKISDIYLKNITNRFSHLSIVGLFDIVHEKAQSQAEKYQVEKVYECLDEVMSDKNVDIVLNLTRPADHYPVSLRALKAGKHVYSEKPMAIHYIQGEELLRLAQEQSLYLGVAPDTFLGAGIQTCKKLIDEGAIGEPVGAVAQMMSSGWESWHPDPDYYYKKGGGPMMDMGPYYVTALVYLLGRAMRVSSMAKAAYKEREILTGYRKGEKIEVEVPTWIQAMMEFENSAMATLLTTFDVQYDREARFEIYGTKGTLLVPDPNLFSGPVCLLEKEGGKYREIPLIHEQTDDLRGLGISEMAAAMEEGRPCRANAEQALHVLDILESVETSYSEDRTVTLRKGGKG